MVRTLLKFVTLTTCAVLLCGFDDRGLEYDLNAWRGAPLHAVTAALGRPIRRQSMDGNRLYYWWLAYDDDRSNLCKIRAVVNRHNVVTSWGYEECKFR